MNQWVSAERNGSGKKIEFNVASKIAVGYSAGDDEPNLV
jgi:hypothetical protein